MSPEPDVSEDLGRARQCLLDVERSLRSAAALYRSHYARLAALATTLDEAGELHIATFVAEARGIDESLRTPRALVLTAEQALTQARGHIAASEHALSAWQDSTGGTPAQLEEAHRLRVLTQRIEPHLDQTRTETTLAHMATNTLGDAVARLLSTTRLVAADAATAARDLDALATTTEGASNIARASMAVPTTPPAPPQLRLLQ